MNKIVRFLLTLSYGIPLFATAQVSPDAYWRDSVLSCLQGKINLSMQVTYSFIKDNVLDTFTFSKYFYVSEKSLVSTDSDSYYLLVTPDSLKLVDWETGNLSYGSRNAAIQDTTQEYYFNLYWNIQDDYCHQVQQYVWFYLFPLRRDSVRPSFKPLRDTMFNGMTYKILQWNKLGGYIIDDKNNSKTPYYEQIFYYFNPASHWVERVEVWNDYMEYTQCFDFINLRFLDNPMTFDTLFNFHHSRYKDFKAYNFQIDPAPSEMGRYSENIVMDDSVKECPLMGTNGKSFFLKDCQDWVLLDFWRFPCKACRLFHLDLKKEKDSLGYRILEKEGIRIFCINYETGMTEKYQEYARSCDLSDIAYASRDISRFLNIPHFPYYYLFSPKGELVFRGDLDYEAMLKAKRQYEKNPKKQIKKAIQCEHSLY